MAQHRVAQHRVAQPGTVQEGTAASCSTARLSKAQPNTAQLVLARPSPGQPCSAHTSGSVRPRRAGCPRCPTPLTHDTSLLGVQHHHSHIPAPLQGPSRGAETWDRGVLPRPTPPSAGPHAPPWCHPHTLPGTTPCPPLPRHPTGSVGTPSTAQVSLPSHEPPRTTPRFPATPSRGVRKTAPAPQWDPARGGPVPPRPCPRVRAPSPLLPPPDLNPTCPHPLR